MGQKDNPEVALGILDEMELLISNKPSGTPELLSHSIIRLLYEYKAYIYAFLLNDFEKAIKEYDKALETSSLDVRGFLKVKLETALLKYFLSKENIQRDEAIKETKSIIEDQLSKDYNVEIEIKQIAEHNLSLMLANEPFETNKFKFYSTI